MNNIARTPGTIPKLFLFDYVFVVRWFLLFPIDGLSKARLSKAAFLVILP